MSRLGKLPVKIPQGVKVEWKGDELVITGPKGSLSQKIPPQIEVEVSETEIRVRPRNMDKLSRALHGTIRQLINNMVIGVTQGFTKELQLVGTGYRVKQEGEAIVLTVGFSHPVRVEPMPGVTLKAVGQDRIVVSGIDKQKVGQMAANIRAIRPPEPYKGKGIRYVGEYVRRKAGKSAVKAQ